MKFRLNDSFVFVRTLAGYLRIAFCANLLAKGEEWVVSRVNNKRRDQINFTQWNGNAPDVIEICRFNQMNNLEGAMPDQIYVTVGKAD